jgi:tetratricopeptide (TPR) repeat protein
MTRTMATTASARGTDRPLPTVITADQLDREAASLRDSAPEYARAVRLLEQSASLRSANDPRAAMSLWWAAWFSYNRSDLPGARAFMEQAADRVLAQGNILAAANDAVDAGLIAQEEGNRDEARRLGAKALELARSPALSAAERASIISRVGDRAPAVGLP